LRRTVRSPIDLNLHAESVKSVLRRAPVKHRGMEAGFLVVRLGGYVAALLLLLPPGKAAAFVGVQLAVFGVLLGGAFAPNHIGMPIVPAGLKVDFLRRQVLMSRNISGGRIAGYALGGLNYQIEHHLFPYRRITRYLNINALGVRSRDRSAAHWSRSTRPDAVGRAGRTETDVSKE